MAEIRTGFATQRGMPYGEALPRAAEMGFDFVEITMDGVHERTRIDADDVRATAEECGLDLLVHLPWRLDIGSPLEHVREGSVRELAAAVETASAFGAEKAVAHASSNAWHPWRRDQIRPLLLDSIRELDRVAGENGVELCVENLPGGHLPLDDFDRLLSATSASVTLDTGHAYADGHDEADMARFLADHADRVSHVHLNDTRSRADDEHLPLGAGFLDFGRIFEGLAGWSGTLSLETYTDDYGYIREGKRRLDGLIP